MTANFPLAGKSPIPADIHAHTHHSHGQAATEAMYAAALDKGLAWFGFSEHSPRPEGYSYPSDYQEKLVSRFPRYIEEVRLAAEQGRKDGMTVLLGIEVDYIPAREDYARALLAGQPFDYVIGGLHFQGTWGFDHSARDWEPLTRDQRFAVYARYYQDLAAMCRTGLFHVAAHPDLVKLFSVETFREWLETPDALPPVRAALAAIKENGMAMEISSAGLRKPCAEIYPGPRIMELAAEMRVPVSFGSDAHCTNTPAFGFDILARYADHYGYAESLIFAGGKPLSLPFTVPPAL